MINMITKALVITLLIATAWSYPQESEYDDYEYEEEEVEYSNEPPMFEVDSQKITAAEGDTIFIPCQNSDTPYVLIIKKAASESEKEKLLFVGGVKVPRDRRFKLNDDKMEISNLKRKDAGNYVCRIEFTPPVEITHELDVQFAPTIEAVTKGEKRVQKGESVSLECSAEGNPKPSITWSRQEGRLPSGAKDEEGHSITLAEVDRHVEGTYVCTADNGIGEAVSDVMSVVVEYKPEIITEKDIVRNDDGVMIELICIVHARPAAKIEWTKDGEPIQIDSHIEEQQHGGHRNSIRITQVTDQDFGDYVCTAENTYGIEESTLSLSGVPKPANFTSDPNGGEENTYTLTWETESFHPITEYNLRYRKAKANASTDEPGDWKNMTFEVNGNLETDGLIHYMKHAIEDLEEATDYNAIVQIKNQFKWGDSAEFSFSTKKEVASQTKTSSAPSVGINALLLVICAIFLWT